MRNVSTAAWVIHDLGLASAIGGSMFGKMALHPSAHHVVDPQQRDEIIGDAWRRFSVVNLLAHAAVLATWLPGRKMLSGREASATARSLTIGKDVLIGTALATGIASAVLGRVLGKRVERGAGPSRVGERIASEGGERAPSRRLDRTVNLLGTANLVCNAAILGITAILAMESSKSVRFPAWARRLP